MTKQTKKVSSDTEDLADKFIDNEDDTQDINGTDREVEEDVPAPKVKPNRVIEEPPRPYRAKERRGRFGEFSIPKTIGLDPRMLPPITKRYYAMYELCDFYDTKGRKKVDTRIIEGPNEVDPPQYELVDTYKIYDRFAELGESEKLLNFERGVIKAEPVTKESKMLVAVNQIVPIFRNGQMRVEIRRNYAQFVWMELHPRNENNKYRDKQKPVVFRRTDLDMRSSHSEILRMDLQDAATRYVRKLDKNAAIALASAMTSPTMSVNESHNDILLGLLQRARTNPEDVLYKAPNKSFAAQLDILQSMDWGILEFDAANNSYSFTNDPDQTIFVVPMEEKPLDALARYFAGEVEGEEATGRETYERMRDMVDYWKQ